jgi:hypothetical protein
MKIQDRSRKKILFFCFSQTKKKTRMIRSVKVYSWNFGKLPRIRAEQLLINEDLGAFLIRESEHFPGDLTLSIKDENKIQHYRIKFDSINRNYTIDDEIFFPDLRLLVQVYRFCSIFFS